MQHFAHLSAATRARIFAVPPEHFDPDGDTRLVATALGATLYSPATSPDLTARVRKQAQRGVTSMVLCLEDAIPDSDVELGEKNVVETLTEQHEAAIADAADGVDAADAANGAGHPGPLLFLRVRRPDQLADLADRLGPALGALTGFVLPKFGPENGLAYLDAISDASSKHGRRLFAMPVMESPQITHEETRMQALSWCQSVLNSRRENVLAVRIGATDLSAVYGLRRSRELTVYDVRVVAQVITDVVNRLGRADGTGFVITGPVWEYFSGGERVFKPRLRQSLFEQHQASELRTQLISRDMDGLIREVELDKANGLTGKTVIHPTHVSAVHALQVVTHEEYADALDVLGSEGRGGVATSGYGNKMNESKPHTAWAERTHLRARVFGVARPDITFVEILAASLLS